jgi:hypothetical protein
MCSAPDYSGSRRQINVLLLVVANALPLLGVVFFDWDVSALIVLYWSENLVIGFYNILKMLSAGGLPAVLPSLFFLVHYGGFCAVHGFFISSLLLNTPPEIGSDPPWPLFLVFVQLLFEVIEQVLAQAPTEWVLAFTGLFISHGYSFVSNFWLGGERETSTINSLMSAPYKRIVVLHIAVIAGSFAVIALGQSFLMLLVLVAMKTGIDLLLHQREHRRARGCGSL